MRLLRYLLYGAFFWELFAPDPVLAQIEVDGTTPTDLSNCQAECRIEGGSRANRNLFHSFREFNVRADQQVRFSNPDGVENIFSRVTGGNLSRISGLLGVDGAANLFLLNPNGILFTPNATLDIRGSFVATTAESIVFDNGLEFSAVNPQPPSPLTISVPIGLQFGSNPGSIINRSQASPDNQTNSFGLPVGLQVQSGRTLALVGGTVSLEGGNLAAIGRPLEDGTVEPSGRIEIGSLAEAGLVELQVIPTGFALNYSNIQNFGNIEFGASVIDTSGEGGGSVRLQGRNILLDSSAIVSQTLGNKQGDAFLINATESLTLNNGSLLSTSTEGEGSAGNIQIRSDTVQLVMSDLGSQACPSESCVGDTGSSGNLIIRARHLLLQDGARIDVSTFGSGSAGDIEIRATNIEIIGSLLDENGQPVLEDGQPITSGILTQVAEGATVNTNDVGNLAIRTNRLTIHDGGQISTATFSNGRAGRLSIDASDFIELSGEALGATEDVGRSGIFSSAEPGATGSAGAVSLTTGQLIVEDGAEVSVRNFGRQAGNLIIDADSISLNNGRLTARTAGGSGANIIIRAVDLLSMQDQSLITAQALGNANGGNVSINAPNGFIVASEAQNSDIIASAEFGQGGRITIDAQGLVGLAERSATPENTTNDIDASSEFGQSGTVIINSLELDPDTLSIDLPAAPVETELAQGCQVEGDVASAAFFNRGRGGIPVTPYEPLSSSGVLEDVRLPEQSSVDANGVENPTQFPTSSDRLVEAQGWTVNESGQVILMAEATPQVTIGCSLQ